MAETNYEHFFGTPEKTAKLFNGYEPSLCMECPFGDTCQNNRDCMLSDGTFIEWLTEGWDD